MLNRKSFIVPEGLPFILVTALLCGIAFLLSFYKTALICLIAAFFVAWFFRNPSRSASGDGKRVVSPADGRVIKIEDVVIDAPVKGCFKKISIFMNVFNVHVNRIPCSGIVKTIEYKKGRFISANLDKASSLNEQNAVVITTEKGRDILTVQIAGLIARRIVCWIEEGMHVKRGDRFGLIRFGSRLDVYLPQDSMIIVNVGDKVRAGETFLGDLR